MRNAVSNNPLFFRFAARVSDWLVSCVYTAREKKCTEQQCRSAFLNAVNHLQGKHDECDADALCRKNPVHHLTKPCLIHSDSSTIAAFKSMLEAVYDGQGGENLVTTSSSSPNEAVNGCIAKFVPKDTDFAVSTECRVSIAILSINESLATVFSQVCSRMGLQPDPLVTHFARRWEHVQNTKNKHSQFLLAQQRQKRAAAVSDTRKENELYPFALDPEEISYGEEDDIMKRVHSLPQPGAPEEWNIPCTAAGAEVDDTFLCTVCKQFPSREDESGYCLLCSSFSGNSRYAPPVFVRFTPPLTDAIALTACSSSSSAGSLQ